MGETSLFERTRAIADSIRSRGGRSVRLCVILGSGLGAFVDSLSDRLVIPYEDIPGFPRSTVPGHAGNLVFGRLGGDELVVMQGRVHFYETGDLGTVVLPLRIMSHLGVRTMFITNSAGSLCREMPPGSFMLLADHINLMMAGSPLTGEHDDRFGPRFPDLSEAYDETLREHVRCAAKELELRLFEGIYCAFHGPEYETPAEVRMATSFGADAVGMSTVPEVVAANQMGIRCVGVSCLSNMAAGISSQKLSHEEVMEVSQLASERFVALVRESVLRILNSASGVG